MSEGHVGYGVYIMWTVIINITGGLCVSRAIKIVIHSHDILTNPHL
jgi:hypothetical protein